MVTAEVQKHCADNGIQIIKLSSGATRFKGVGIDIVLSDGNTPKLENLKPYQARKGSALRNI